MNDAYLSLGSNIGNACENLAHAVAALTKIPGVNITCVSSFYKTAPVGFTEQRDFINICVSLQTDLSAGMLLGCCLGIEASMGRERPFKNSPRVIDIDLIIYGNIECDTTFLTLPHPRFRERAFVLLPLREIMPEIMRKLYDIGDLSGDTALQRVEKLNCERIGGISGAVKCKISE